MFHQPTSLRAAHSLKGPCIRFGDRILRQEARQDLDPGELYAVLALRYLLTGIDHYPTPFEVTDINLLKCAV